jgi:hypothetical protein
LLVGAALRLEIKDQAHEHGDIQTLTDDLDGFCGLWVGSFRVIFEYETVRGKRTATCVFAGARRWVYKAFRSRLME